MQICSFSSTVWSTPARDYHNPRISPFRPVGHSGEENSEGKNTASKAGWVREAQRDQSLCAFSKELLKRAPKTTPTLSMRHTSIMGLKMYACPGCMLIKHIWKAPRNNGRGDGRVSTAKPWLTGEHLIQLQQVGARRGTVCSDDPRRAVLKQPRHTGRHRGRDTWPGHSLIGLPTAGASNLRGSVFSHAGDKRQNEEQVHLQRGSPSETWTIVMQSNDPCSLTDVMEEQHGDFYSRFFFSSPPLFPSIICGTEKEIWKRPKSRN